MKKRVFVTGSSGYLGSKIVRALIKNQFHVTGLDLVAPAERLDDLVFVQGDLLDLDLEKLFAGNEFVIHTAALVPLTRAYSEFNVVNTIGSQRAARAAKSAGVDFFVHISSSAIFGKVPSTGLIPWDTVPEPVEPYGVSKSQAEEAVRSELEKSSTRFALIRPRTIIGPDRGGIFDLFFSWIRDSKPVFTIGAGDNLFQFVHVDDLISAILFVIEHELEGGINIGTDDFNTLNELFQGLIAHANSKSKVVHLPEKFTMLSLKVLERLKLSPLAPWHYLTFHYNFAFDVAPLVKLGWKPEYSNSKMFTEAYDSYVTDSQVHRVSSEASPHSKALNPRLLKHIQRLWK